MQSDHSLPRSHSRAGLFAGLALVVGAAVVWSAIAPSHGYFNWSLEAFPVLIGALLLVATYRRFPLTSLCYVLISAHAIILLVGAHYTYAGVPLFNWLRDTLDLSRNHYDRLGHFVQGFVPAVIAREILLRASPLRPGKWLFFLVCCVCLAFSACYEFFEWWVALATTPEQGDAFLGTQGDVWDTQTDMFLALVGAILSQLLLSRRHDHEINAVVSKRSQD